MPRWHFKMLNDRTRNIAYRDAIYRALEKDVDSVIDIGCGCGLLSLFASKGPKIKKIYAIEASKAFCKIAKNVFQANEANVNLINTYSTQLNDGKVKGNLIVTEIFDAALFGEHMLDIIVHALDNLVEDNFEIIPYSATVYVTGINSEQLLKVHRVYDDYPEIMLNGKYVYVNEPYVVEDLTNFDVDYLTETKPIMTVNFKDVDMLKRFVKENGLQSSSTVKCIKNGTINAIALWFDLNLDETIKITTNPFELHRAKCWEQAIFYINSPKAVTVNEEATVYSAVVDNKLQLFISDITVEENKDFPVSQEIVSFLNDQYLVNQIKEMASHFVGEVDVYVMDFNSFPLFGFLLAKQGAALYCQARCENDKALIEHVARVNKLEKINIVTYEQAFYVREFLPPIDILFLPPVSSDGSVDESNLGLLPMYATKLKPTGVHITRSVNLWFEIVQCEYLETWNRVDDKNVCGFKVAEFFKEFEVTEHACINYKSLKYKKLSETMYAGDVLERCGRESLTNIDVPIKETGMANGILYWYEFLNFNNSKFDTRKGSYYRCAAFLFPKFQQFTADSNITVIWKQSDACISLSIAD